MPLFSFSSGLPMLLVSALLVCFIAILHFHFSVKQKYSILILLLGVFLLRLFDVFLDPFLGYWDEQYHALVGKNLSRDFFKPMLYSNPILPYDYKGWVGNHIWVHKQPFFLWQIALSIKIFGAKVFAVRVPSAICFTFATFCIYKIGKNISNASIGFYSAFLFGTNYYFSEMCAGYFATDHNDSAFICYVTASIWAFTEHLKNPGDKKWIILIGLFSGVAILNKWLVGLVVYLLWGIYILFTTNGEFYNPKHYKKVALSLLITIAIAAPWQIYSFLMFHKETVYEMGYNAKHLTEALEGHVGDAYFYFDNLSVTYGRFAPFFILPGLILLFRFFSDKKCFYAFSITTIVIFTFYTFVATKMNSFTLIICCFIFLGFAAFVYMIRLKIKDHFFSKILMSILILLIGVANLKIGDKQLQHAFGAKDSEIGEYRRQEIQWKGFCKNLRTLLPDKNHVVFNCAPFHQINLMFYTDFIAYSGLPNDQQVQEVLSKGYKVAIIDDGKLDPAFYDNKSYLIIRNIP